MDRFLGLITQSAMNYAIRSGIGITAGYAIKQSSRLLKTVDDNNDYQELQSLQERLNTKIRIISPAIDMIDLISARGNTTLESAATLTKELRWDIQSLGARLEKAAAAEETSRMKSTKAKSKAAHAIEIRGIIKDIQRLLTKIEDNVSLLNLAITTSGASLSTNLPATVSPSRLLQASTFLTAGDTQYSINPGIPVQVGPTFKMSLYMLFAGHAHRAHDTESVREMTWKEVINKAQLKLLRTPLHVTPNMKSSYGAEPLMSEDAKVDEYAYHIEIIEDLDDDRVHSFEDGDVQPGPYGGVPLAGIRENLPIHQICKIFYADTGKILNIGNAGEANSPILLLKRDVDALPPRSRMQEEERNDQCYDEEIEESEITELSEVLDSSEDEGHDSQDDIDAQLRRESSIIPVEDFPGDQPGDEKAWRLPLDLDPEWLALSVYTEPEDSSSESGDTEVNDDSAYISHRPSSSGDGLQESASLSVSLAALNISQSSPSPSPSLTPADYSLSPRKSSMPMPTPSPQPASNSAPYGQIRTSLSLLEMLIRLTCLQQFRQESHLATPDEFLTFFLEESSTTGAGGDADSRKRTRNDALRKVGFDPYNESPVKHHGEDYQYGYGGMIPEEYDNGGSYRDMDREVLWRGSRGNTPMSPQQMGTPEPWLLRSREISSSGPQKSAPDFPPSSPVSPYRPVRKSTRPLQRVKQEGHMNKRGSPLGRSVSVDTDSTLGTSPGSPTLVNQSKGERMLELERGEIDD
ncbi:RanGTP-binding protein-domain-containing protein [Tricladium varicosporioides]|nr:RanGTP-binding protein-domain-containing protein [Hymenoscyphus varicosporioides]